MCYDKFQIEVVDPLIKLYVELTRISLEHLASKEGLTCLVTL